MYKTVCIVFLIFVFLIGCTNEYENIENNSALQNNTESSKLENIEKENMKKQSWSMEIPDQQLFHNTFDDFVFYTNILSDSNYPGDTRKNASKNLSILFDMNAGIEDIINGRVYNMSVNEYTDHCMRKNEKCFFTNVSHDFGLINETRCIIYTASKMIYDPVQQNKKIILLSVRMNLTGSKEPSIAEIRIKDVEECQ
jgi:hypothetical protein